MLNHVGIGHHFKTIVGYDNVKKPKPHPEMVNKILEIHNISNQNAQLIGDSHKDIMAATKAGVDSVLVNWGFSNHEKDAIETIEELEKRIFEKFK
jgi:phosphoglycolate phosphatase